MAKNWTDKNKYNIPYMAKGIKEVEARSLEGALLEFEDWVKRTKMFGNQLEETVQIINEEITCSDKSRFDHPEFTKYMLEGTLKGKWGGSISKIKMAKEYFDINGLPYPPSFPEVRYEKGGFQVVSRVG